MAEKLKNDGNCDICWQTDRVCEPWCRANKIRRGVEGNGKVKEPIVCISVLDGKIHQTRIVTRVVYHRAVPTIAGTGDFVISMGRKLPVFITAMGTKYYEVSARTIGK